MAAKHIGIVGVSAEGAALCYRTICLEGERYLGRHDHPEVSMHTHSLREYMKCIERDDWNAVAHFLICPDNPVHQAFAYVEARSPLPWIHIADVVGDEARSRNFTRLALTGTKYLVQSDVYPARL